MAELGSKPKIYIVGRSIIQNELLVRHIETSTGYPIVVCREADEISTDKIRNQKTLILLDFTYGNWDTIWPILKQKVNLLGVDCFVALFNVNQINEIEKEVTKYGIRGIFYEHYSCDTLIKGIKAILKGDLWLSRNLMKSIFFQHQYNELSKPEKVDPLSFRENQILNLLVSGHTNGMISDELCISCHTVKTHVYNIYKKINVCSRLQAVRWASNSLCAYSVSGHVSYN
jgi:DNA-binding NarL/FixJ family response regulator